MTFASQVDPSTLLPMVTLLSRYLQEKLATTGPHVTSVADNVAKLIDSSITARLFVPKLPPPGLVGAKTSVGSPEACGTVGRAIATLRRIDGVPTNSDGSNLAPIKTAEHTSQVDVLITFYKE